MKNPDRPDVHFRVPKEDYKFLKAVAKAEDRSLSYIVGRIVKQWLKAHENGQEKS